jgi:hypothetical protein
MWPHVSFTTENSWWMTRDVLSMTLLSPMRMASMLMSQLSEHRS